MTKETTTVMKVTTTKTMARSAQMASCPQARKTARTLGTTRTWRMTLMARRARTTTTTRRETTTPMPETSERETKATNEIESSSITANN